jgi:beta-N-acetylhexosaminidase
MQKITVSILILLFLGSMAMSFDFRNIHTIKPSETVIAKLQIDSLPKVKVKTAVLEPAISLEEKKWVDSVYFSMTLEQKIGQLFMVAAYSNKDSAHIKKVEKLIQDYHVGGLIFFQGGPVRQAKLTNHFQSIAKTPLFIGIDAEWGMSMRLDSTFRYPWNMSLGAITDLKLIEKMGAQMAQQSKRLGVHFTFAPVIDINTNPKNPIIGNRSFGEEKEAVTERAIAYMKGLQSNGVFATAKHFPGHGDTDKDSHYTLPTVSFDKDRIEDVELYPYKKMIKAGLASVMVAHLNVPALESREGFPSSISYDVVTNLLQKDLNFKGLIFTDALNMKGASNFKKPGDIDLEAFKAGNDILLFPEDVPTAVSKLVEAYQATEITEERLALSVKKILQYKYRAHLNEFKEIETTNLYQELHDPAFEALNTQMFQQIQTLLKNDNQILPIKSLEKEKIAYIKLGDDSHETFLETLNYFTEVEEVSDSTLDGLIQKLNSYTKVIVGFHKADGAWKKQEFTDKEMVWLYEIARTNQVIFASFAKPYVLLPVSTYTNFESVLVAYQNHPSAQRAAAEVIFGTVEAKGKLPVSLGDDFKSGFGLKTKKLDRLGFSVPELVGMDSKILQGIDVIAQNAIHLKMTPGIQVLVARKGKVVYHKSYGYHTYDSLQVVKNSDLYDVASLTKILATLPNVMKLYDQDGFNLQTKLKDILPVFASSDKKNIEMKDLLTHQARLQPWVPFYKATLDKNGKPDAKYYQTFYSKDFSKQVAERLFIRNDYHDSIIQKIVKSKLLPKKEYKYSDFTFIILREILEQKTKKTLDVLSHEQFYQTIGAQRTTFNPLKKFDMSEIVPTENDQYFRHQKLQGYVHDMGAAMNGGVDGHAGLFSNAMDVAKIMQMYLQKGHYGGNKYFSEATFDDFNTCYFCDKGNRRGLGFDKPQLGNSGPTCGCVPMSSFGHTGFTGTMTWADPENELVYVFLSNRTYPNADENKLSKANVRESIQKVIYDAIIK